uniref:Uncharacterized protein n=1 Tax=Rhizochromulina marina TaxID=1034831 RepID=A0A7S2S7L6_9STRA
MPFSLQIESILREILPPVTTAELEQEVASVMKAFAGQEFISIDEFTNMLKANAYWVEAGELVVKELMYLDCLQSNYNSKKALLSDDDYDELKDSLTWDGSALVTLSGDEARFLYAVACSKKQIPSMTDAEYQSLKARLKEEGSWTVNREKDPLEKLGLSTLVGYIHRSFGN